MASRVLKRPLTLKNRTRARGGRRGLAPRRACRVKRRNCIELAASCTKSRVRLESFSQDPIGFQAGDANLYRYVGNAATVMTDPSGLEPPLYGPDGIAVPVDGGGLPITGGTIVPTLPEDIISNFPQEVQTELNEAIEAGLSNDPSLWGWVESFESTFDFIPFVNPELGGTNEGPCERWTTGVLQQIEDAITSPTIVPTQVTWQIDGGNFWSGHQAIRIEVYDPNPPDELVGNMTLLGIIYIDNGVLGGSDNIFSTYEIPLNYYQESPANTENGLDIMNAGPPQEGAIQETAPTPPRNDSDHNPHIWQPPYYHG